MDSDEQKIAMLYITYSYNGYPYNTYNGCGVSSKIKI